VGAPSPASTPGVHPRHEPPPLDRKPSGSILKRSPSGNHLENGMPLPDQDGVHPASPQQSSVRTQRSSHESAGRVAGRLARLTGAATGPGQGRGEGGADRMAMKRMSFSDQHGMDLSVVHEVTDTHYKRTCIQRNASLITMVVCIVVTIVCGIAIAVIFTSQDDGT